MITAKEIKSIRDAQLPDAYDGDVLNEGQIHQQIEQIAQYTDFIVFKGQMDGYILSRLDKKGFYTNTMLDKGKGEDVWYTIISW